VDSVFFIDFSSFFVLHKIESYFGGFSERKTKTLSIRSFFKQNGAPAEACPNCMIHFLFGFFIISLFSSFVNPGGRKNRYFLLGAQFLPPRFAARRKNLWVVRLKLKKSTTKASFRERMTRKTRFFG